MTYSVVGTVSEVRVIENKSSNLDQSNNDHGVNSPSILYIIYYLFIISTYIFIIFYSLLYSLLNNI